MVCSATATKRLSAGDRIALSRTKTEPPSTGVLARRKDPRTRAASMAKLSGTVEMIVGRSAEPRRPAVLRLDHPADPTEKDGFKPVTKRRPAKTWGGEGVSFSARRHFLPADSGLPSFDPAGRGAALNSSAVMFLITRLSRRT